MLLLPNRRGLLGAQWCRERLWRAAGEVPSFHIAPARTRDARDLISGSVLGTYNSASPAWAVGPDGILYQPAANAPVIEFDPVTGACLGARIWGAVTNLRPYSERILAGPDVAVYGAVSSTLVQQTATSPIQGLSTVSKLTLNNGANTGNSSDGMNFGSTVNLTVNTVYTQSIFVKAAGSSVLRLRSNVTGQVFDIPIAGPAPTPTGTVSACTVQVLPNGWSRISWTFTAITGTPASRSDHWALKTDIANGTDGILMTGAQFNIGPLGPYVPTTATAASSTADVWTITGADFSRIWNQSAVTFYAEAARDTVLGTEFPVLIDARTANSSEIVQCSYLVETLAGSLARSNNVIQAELYPNIPANTRTRRIAAAFAQDNFATCANGETVLTDSSGTMPSPDRINLGSISTGQFLNGYIRELATFRSRRPNANLQAMTQ